MTFVSQAGGEVMVLWFASYYQVFDVNLKITDAETLSPLWVMEWRMWNLPIHNVTEAAVFFSLDPVSLARYRHQDEKLRFNR
jgi:hypothetical protein